MNTRLAFVLALSLVLVLVVGGGLWACAGGVAGAAVAAAGTSAITLVD